MYCGFRSRCCCHVRLSSPAGDLAPALRRQMMAINRKSTVTASTQHACVGSLAAHLDKFAELLVGEGDVSQTIKAEYALAADLSHWAKQRVVSLSSLDAP